jgi:hypothetical protein
VHLPRRIVVLLVVLIISLLFPGALLGSVNSYGDGLGEQFGHVSFANSGAPAAQADFLQAMALLHDFEYPAAAAAFRRAQSTDPGFAMAYWGEAMTFNHPLWAQQDLKAARTALEKLAPTAAARRVKAKSDREKAYLDAAEVLYGEGSKEERDFRYSSAMSKVHESYPDDVDATRSTDSRFLALRTRDATSQHTCAPRGCSKKHGATIVSIPGWSTT